MMSIWMIMSWMSISRTTLDSSQKERKKEIIPWPQSTWQGGRGPTELVGDRPTPTFQFSPAETIFPLGGHTPGSGLRDHAWRGSNDYRGGCGWALGSCTQSQDPPLVPSLLLMTREEAGGDMPAAWSLGPVHPPHLGSALLRWGTGHPGTLWGRLLSPPGQGDRRSKGRGCG